MVDIEISSIRTNPVRSDASTVMFEVFFRRTYKRLIQIAMYAGASMQEAEDAAGQTMIQVLNSWETIKDPGPWARRAVVRNFVKAKIRNADGLRRIVAGGLATPDAHVDAALTVWENSEWVAEMLGRLPAVQRQVMLLILDDLTPAQVALVLGKTASAVRKNLERARARLKRELKRDRADGNSCGGPPKTTGSEAE